MIKEFINIVESMEGITDDWFKKDIFAQTYDTSKD